MSQPPSERDLFVGDGTLMFMHLSKTGGTSIRETLAAAYKDTERQFVYDPDDLRGAVKPNDLARLPESRRAQLRLVMGHYRYGLHESLGRPFRYVAIIRDPVDRVVSLYYHYLHLRGALLSRFHFPGFRRSAATREEQARMRQSKISLEDWVFGQGRLIADNGQTRDIAARGRVPFGQCAEDLLDEALAHVDRHFEVLLVTEALDQCQPILRAITGRDIPDLKRRNTNRKRPRVEDLDPRVLDRIRELNRLDQRLYERSRQSHAAAAARVAQR